VDHDGSKARYARAQIPASWKGVVGGSSQRILTTPLMKKFFSISAAVVAFSWIADAKDFPIICSVVVSTDAGDKTGEKLGITYDGFVAKISNGDEWHPRHGNFATAFKTSPVEMKWLGFVHGNRGLDTTIRLVGVWTKNGPENGRGGHVSTYVETIANGKQTSKLVSECQQN
jgi:hypothetical protein